MKRAFIILAALLVAGGAVLIWWPRDDGGPFPSGASLATNGFAVWPEDALEEGHGGVPTGLGLAT